MIDSLRLLDELIDHACPHDLQKDQEKLQDLLTYIKTDDGSEPAKPASSSSAASSTRQRSRPSSTQSHPASANVESDADDDLVDDGHLQAPPRTSSSSRHHRPPQLALAGTSASTSPNQAQASGSNPTVVPPSPTESFASNTNSVLSQSARRISGASSSLATPPSPGPVNPDGFAQRRKRAAKLSSFFGVDHKVLFTEVLDVLESEVVEDGMSGSLSPEELQVRSFVQLIDIGSGSGLVTEAFALPRSFSSNFDASRGPNYVCHTFLGYPPVYFWLRVEHAFPFIFPDTHLR